MELLVFIAIVVILAALVLNTSSGTHRISADKRAKAEISALSSALESYKADNGYYPAGTNQVLSPRGHNLFLRNALQPETGKAYFEFGKGMINASGSLVDPYGNALGYQYPGATNRNGSNGFDLWSGGKKPSRETEWVKNW